MIRAYATLLREHGLTVTTHRHRRHDVLRCRTKTGRSFLITLPHSASDWRVIHNIKARIKRLTKGD